MQNWIKIIRIARRVRRKCEAYAKGDKVAIFPSDLTGMCAIASAILHQTLRTAGIPADFYCGTYDGNFGQHCWVQVGAKIIDITATQFKIKSRVYIPNRNESLKYFGLKDNSLTSVTDWAYGQAPHPNVIKAILEITA